MEKEMIRYVDMILHITSLGRIVPLKIGLGDGREWIIDRLIHSCPVTDDEGNTKGFRYTVLIGGAEKYIYEQSGRWYVLSAPRGGGN